MPINVIVSERFLKDLKSLRKRFPHVLTEAKGLRDLLEAGELPGDRIPDLPNPVYKARVQNTDAKRGKSGGYRVIYLRESPEQVALITIYSKTDKGDLPNTLIRHLIEEYKQRG